MNLRDEFLPYRHLIGQVMLDVSPTAFPLLSNSLLRPEPKNMDSITMTEKRRAEDGGQ